MKWSTVIVGSISIGVLYACVAGDNKPKTVEAEKPDPYYTWQAGEGFTKVRTKQGEIVAYKFTKGDGVEVKSLNGCKSLFVNANAYDSNDVVVDDDVEVARHVSPNQSARLNFNFYRGETWKVTEINCFDL